MPIQIINAYVDSNHKIDESKIDESIRRNTHVRKKKTKNERYTNLTPTRFTFHRKVFVFSCVWRRRQREKIVVISLWIRCCHLAWNIYRGWCVRDKEKWKCAAKCLISVFCFLSCSSALLRTGKDPIWWKLFRLWLEKNFQIFFYNGYFFNEISSFD